jgi:hypothetical protein
MGVGFSGAMVGGMLALFGHSRVGIPTLTAGGAMLLTSATILSIELSVSKSQGLQVALSAPNRWP